MIGEDYKTGTEYAFRVPLRDSTGALQPGLTPTVAIYKPDNTAESSPPALTELGSTGVYRFAYTPAAAGAYTFIVSASGCLTSVFTVQVRSADRGDVYNRIGEPAGASIAADIAALPTDADVQSAAAAALTSYDPPTKAELDSAMLPLALEATAQAVKAKTDNLPTSPAAVGSAMTLTEGERSSIATAVWEATTRTLSSFGTLVSDVWSAATRTLTSFGTLAADVWSHATGAAVADATSRIPAEPAAVGSEMDLVDAPNATALAAIADAVLGEEVNSASATDNTLRAAAKAAWAQGFGRWVLSGTTLTLYGTDGSTPVRVFTLDNADTPTSRTPA